MADATHLSIGENTPDYIAYRLMRDIAQAEGRSFVPNATNPVDRVWILQTFAQCAAVVKNGWSGKDAMKEVPM